MAESGFSETSASERRLLAARRSAWPVWPWLILLVALVGVIVWRVTGGGVGEGDDEGERHPAIGIKLPELALEPLVGNAWPVKTADLDGKVTLINYWGPWCGPCAMEFPYMIELERHFRGQ